MKCVAFVAGDAQCAVIAACVDPLPLFVIDLGAIDALVRKITRVATPFGIEARCDYLQTQLDIEAMSPPPEDAILVVVSVRSEEEILIINKYADAVDVYAITTLCGPASAVVVPNAKPLLYTSDEALRYTVMTLLDSVSSSSSSSAAAAAGSSTTLAMHGQNLRNHLL
jgi:hypothetical protein